MPPAPTSASPARPEGEPETAERAVRVSVRFFAVLRERRGRDAERISVPAGTTVAELYRELFPPIDGMVLPVLFAINRAYASGETVLDDGDEVAFIPPLGGG